MPQIAVDEKAELSFNDGRHRFAWLREQGAKSVQVQLHLYYFDLVTSILSAELNVTQYFKPLGND